MKCPTWFWRGWYRWVDRSLERTVDFAERREAMERGEWNRFIGVLGENLTVKYLRRKGKKPLYRNFRAAGGGEVDLVYRDRDTLVFCEVKTRTSENFSRPAEAVDRKKQRLIVRGANAWLRELEKSGEVSFRFDIAEVWLVDGKPPRVNVLVEAFHSKPEGPWL